MGMDFQDTYEALLESTRLPESVVLDVLYRYFERIRVYHSECHLRRIAQYVSDHKLMLTQAQAIAILFHDAVYIPFAPEGHNEELSALLLRITLAREDVAETVRIVAEQIVRDTATHIPTITESALVLDLDLLGLADSYETLQADSKMVYEELVPVIGTWEQYTEKRASFFKHLLGRPKILHSRELEHMEGRLRENLTRSIDEFIQTENTNND